MRPILVIRKKWGNCRAATPLLAATRTGPTRSYKSTSKWYGTTTPNQSEVFDRDLKKRQRAWALSLNDGEYYDYLREESARQICDRLDDITRTFPVALDLGGYRGHLFREISSRSALGEGGGGIGGIKKLYEVDIAVDSETDKNTQHSDNTLVERVRLRGNEENPLSCVEKGSVDIVLSSLSMHWVNDLPGALQQIKEVLRPDGCFLGSVLGGATLQELRYCFYLAEQERRGGISPHVSPLITPSDMAGLMQGAGFALPTIDIETVTVAYPDALTLMEHLARMGEGSAALNRQFHVGRDTFLAAAALYQEIYGLEDGSVPATFQTIYMIGWAPHESQPKCLKRGSGSVSMKTIANQKTHES